MKWYRAMPDFSHPVGGLWQLEEWRWWWPFWTRISSGFASASEALRRMPAAIALAVLMSVGVAEACSPSFARYPHATVVKQNAQYVVANVFAYGGGFAPQQQQSDPEVRALLAAQTKAIQELTEMVRLLAAAQQANLPKPAELTGKELFEKKGKCIDCHRADNKEKGVGFVLAELGNNLPRFGDGERRLISRELKSKRMPPKSVGVQLTDAEIAKIEEYLFKEKEQ